MQTRLLHVRANVRDLDRALAWYRDLLGFELASVWPPERPNYAHFATAEGATFAIGMFEPLFDTSWGARKFTILDPDGSELSFVKG